MATEIQAKNLKEKVREWFSTEDGIKSSNKGYIQTPYMRNVNAVKAAVEINKFEKTRGNMSSWSALGEKLVHENRRFGNCAYMSAVACHYAKNDNQKIWMVDPQGDHQFCILAEVTPVIAGDLKSCANLNDAFVVDPWANLHCSVNSYAVEFEKKMKKWFDCGKRIRNFELDKVTDVVKNHTDISPIDGDYVKSILETKVRVVPGWSF